MFTSMIGGIVKTILSPVTKLIFSGLYSFLIRGPLTLLNIEDRVLGYATNSFTDKLLFNTSLVDGKPQLNFFSGNSPLKPFYMSMVAAGGLLLTLFIGFAIIGTFTKNKGKPGVIKKLGQMTLSASAVVIVPTAFITAVSLSGAIISSLSGRNIAASKKDIATYKSFLNDRINAISNNSYDSLPFNKTQKSNFNQELMGKNPNTKRFESPWNATLNIDKIYDYLTDPSDKNVFKSSDDIRTITSQSKDAYKIMNDSLFRYANNGNKTSVSLKLNQVNSNGVNLIAKTKSIISKLTPKYKNENDSDITNDLLVSLAEIQNKIIEWKKSVDQVISYLPSTVTTGQDAAIHNLQVAFNTIWGNTQSSSSNTTQITNMSELNDVISEIISGDVKTGKGGLYILKQQISNFNDSTLVKTFYRVVTGNKDDNWDRSFSSLKSGGTMLLIGFIMIIAAILMLAGIIIEAFIRIILLGLLFIFGGVLIPISPLDNGARIKTWINVVVGQLISIFGVILILRFGFVIMGRFGDILDSMNDFSGSQGYLTKSISMAFFAYAVMQGANKSRQLLLQIAGSNQGLMNNPGSWMGQFTGGFSRIWASGKKFGKVTGTGLGLSMAKKATGYSSSSGDTNSTGGGVLNNFKSNWTNRGRKAISTIKSPNRALAKMTKGKLGSSNARTSVLDSTSSKLDSKIGKLQSQKTRQERKDSNLKQLNIAKYKNTGKQKKYKNLKSKKGGK